MYKVPLLFFSLLKPQRTLVPSFFYLSIYLSSFSLFVFGLITMIDHFKLIQIFPFTCNFMWFIKLRASAGISGYVWGVQVCEWARVYTVVGRVIRMCACVWNEFLEFLLENRIPTSADFNTYPIQIFWCLKISN